MADNDIGRRLDMVIAILKLAHREEIESARASIRRNKVSAAILDGTANWRSAGDLQKTVAKKAGQAERTVRDRIAELIDLGVLERRGRGPTTAYRATGLI